MDTTVANSPVFNDYWNVIKNWSDEMKAALMAKLMESFQKSKEKENLKSWDRFFGSMKYDPYYPSARELEEYVKDKDKDYEKMF